MSEPSLTEPQPPDRAVSDWQLSKVFLDRADAGRRLAGVVRDRLRPAPDEVVVVGLSRGGVPVAREVARALDAPLDVMVVRKLGVPFQPELAMGAVAEDGGRYVDQGIVAAAGVTAEELAVAEQRERLEVGVRALRYRGRRRPLPLSGRVAVLIDDGLATGATIMAACRTARTRGAREVVVAVPVSPSETLRKVAAEADEVLAVQVPRDFLSVGQWYRNFEQVTDEDVARCLAEPATARASSGSHAAPVPGSYPVQVSERLVTVQIDGIRLHGDLTLPAAATGLVVVADGGGEGRRDWHNRRLASKLTRVGLATALFDLLTAPERSWSVNRLDVELLAERLVMLTQRVRADFPWIAYYGTGPGAAAILRVAARPDAELAALVARNGRLDLVTPWLAQVRAPTLLLVDHGDGGSLRRNKEGMAHLQCPNKLTVLPEPPAPGETGRLDTAAEHATAWILNHGLAAGAA
jgi:putative phosphoribosyl transferase